MFLTGDSPWLRNKWKKIEEGTRTWRAKEALKKARAQTKAKQPKAR